MRGTHIRQVIQSQNKIIYAFVNVLTSIVTENNQQSKINHMRSADQTQYYCYRCSINTTDFPVVNVYVTDFISRRKCICD